MISFLSGFWNRVFCAIRLYDIRKVVKRSLLSCVSWLQFCAYVLPFPMKCFPMCGCSPVSLYCSLALKSPASIVGEHALWSISFSSWL